METKTIEMELPEDGISMEQSFDAPNGIQMVDDIQYKEMLSKFVNIIRQQQNLTLLDKIKKKLKGNRQ